MLIPAKSFGDTGIAPAMHDKHGPGYKKSDVEKVIVKMINSDQYFKEQAKQMSTDTEKAIELTEDVNARFSKTLDNFQSTTKKFTEQAKNASGGVRDAADKLVERAAKAMELLATLEQSGKLEKIAGALR
jgi:peroxiredoxin